ncbi:exodeoxyribonuclease I [Spongorhabdus nitratireducens]
MAITVQTFYFYDFETSGADPARDRPLQFAGIRTDADFNEIEKEDVWYCQPAEDVLPHPEACLITGILPQEAAEKGLTEKEFAHAIHQAFSRPKTCVAGYNSIRFDDEVTRYCFYRNFLDPYSREWQNGNSRWDLIDVVRATAAFRPDGINWPLRDGRRSFKLEELSVANNIEHLQAHDALSDVRATIAMAKLVKEKQPRLFSHLLSLRDKRQVLAKIDPLLKNPVLHVSGMYGTDRNNLAVVLPIAMHPDNRNGVIVYDLSVDPAPLLKLSVEEVQQRIFTPKADLPEGIERIPLKTIHVNRCPVIAPLKVLDESDQKRLQLDYKLCQRHYDQLIGSDSVAEKVQAVFSSQFKDGKVADAELQLYGGFFSDRDRRFIRKVSRTDGAALKHLQSDYDDVRLDALLFRYRARNFPDSLSDSERAQWNEHCRSRVLEGQDGFLSLNSFQKRVGELRAELAEADRHSDIQLLKQLEEYVLAQCERVKQP